MLHVFLFLFFKELLGFKCVLLLVFLFHFFFLRNYLASNLFHSCFSLFFVFLFFSFQGIFWLTPSFSFFFYFFLLKQNYITSNVSYLLRFFFFLFFFFFSFQGIICFKKCFCYVFFMELYGFKRVLLHAFIFLTPCFSFFFLLSSNPSRKYLFSNGFTSCFSFFFFYSFQGIIRL